MGQNLSSEKRLILIPDDISSFFGGVILLTILTFCGLAFYNIFFHPLSKFPGPKYAAATGWTWWIILWRGELADWVKKMHETYGEVVRVGPDRLSYISPQACKDIYGHRTTKRLENPKDTRSYEPEFNGADHIINVPDVTRHGELRKIFTNAFSDRALKLQEPLISKYVDRLIENMHRMTKQRLDMVMLYNSTTFDIMGELAFGESLGLLESSDYSPWVKAVFANIKVGVFSQVGLEYPLLRKIIRLCLPRSILEQQKTHFQHSIDRVDRRLEKGNDQPDIWNLVLQKADNKLSLDEMYANSSIFMMAGTETTATLLSGLTYHLLNSPDKLRIATEEIRSLPEEELTLQNLPRLTYLSACFEEGLRCYPPVPVGPTREVAKGGNAICGQWIPEKTRVAVPNWAAYQSPLNFKDPESFIPERWLAGTGFDSDRKDVFQPFSSGPRNCLGKNLAYHEMRIILAKVLWHFDLQLCAESNNWADQKTYGLWEKPELWFGGGASSMKHRLDNKAELAIILLAKVPMSEV